MSSYAGGSPYRPSGTAGPKLAAAVGAGGGTAAGLVSGAVAEGVPVGAGGGACPGLAINLSRCPICVTVVSTVGIATAVAGLVLAEPALVELTCCVAVLFTAGIATVAEALA